MATILSGFPVDVVLRDESQAVIRPMAVTDAEAVEVFFRGLPEEDRMFLNEDVMTDGWINRHLAMMDFRSTIPILALRGNRVLGHAMLQRTLYGWMTHVGQVRVSVARDSQRLGLGTALVRQLVRMATNSSVEKLVARVMENQERVLLMFERCGFHREALLYNHVKDLHGNKHNLVILANEVSRIWETMEALLDQQAAER